MNRERIQKLRDHLASLPTERFNYRSWFQDPEVQRCPPKLLAPECKTTACLGGWALALFSLSDVGFSLSNTAQRLLDLDDEQADFLFHTNSYRARLRDAVKRLDHLLTSDGVIQGYRYTQESWAIDA